VLEVGEIAVLRNWSKRIGRRTEATTGAEALVGKVAEVTQDCRPTGMVRLEGELWEARCEEGASRGDAVVVERLDGLTLVVSPKFDPA
jgi:membrane protein implicated in regulation of membrane protease activity